MPSFDELMLARQSIQPDTGGRGVLGILRDVNMTGASTQGVFQKQIVQGGIAGIAGKQGPPGLLAKLGLSPKDILADLAKVAGNQNLQALQQMNAGSIASMPAGTNVSPSAAPDSSVVMASMGSSQGNAIG